MSPASPQTGAHVHFGFRATLSETVGIVAASLIGQKLGDYEVVSRLGTGGMGAVFEARHPVIGKRVAIKVLHPAFAKDPRALERFVNEARVVNTIGHPAVVDIFSFGETSEGLHYFVMEFLKGRSVDQLVEGGPLPLGQALELGCQLLEVLDKAHQANVVHRDLKPQNLVVEDGPSGQRLRVLDFGIAKSISAELKQQLTGSAILGTPGYMAPEQIDSAPVTPRTDLYSTGAVLFELLTGKRVLEGSNIGQLLLKALHEPARRASSVKPDVPAEVDDFVASLLERDPSSRPPSARAALETLRRLQAELQHHGSLPTRSELPIVKEPAKRPMVPGVDDKATNQVKAHRPSVDMHEVGQRTEPAWEARHAPAPAMPPPQRGSNPSMSKQKADEPSTRATPKVESKPAPVPEAVVATAIDRKMVARMREVEAPPGGGAVKWVVLAGVGLLAGLGAWWFSRG